jgi:hypothetical protein
VDTDSQTVVTLLNQFQSHPSGRVHSGYLGKRITQWLSSSEPDMKVSQGFCPEVSSVRIHTTTSHCMKGWQVSTGFLKTRRWAGELLASSASGAINNLAWTQPTSLGVDSDISLQAPYALPISEELSLPPSLPFLQCPAVCFHTVKFYVYFRTQTSPSSIALSKLISSLPVPHLPVCQRTCHLSLIYGRVCHLHKKAVSF